MYMLISVRPKNELLDSLIHKVRYIVDCIFTGNTCTKEQNELESLKSEILARMTHAASLGY